MAAIFILDDDNLIRRSLATQLRQIHGEVEAFETPDQLLPRMGERPALVICDYILDGRDGVEVASAVKRASPATKTLLLSGGDEDEVISAARENGVVDAFLGKPWTQDELISAVRQLIGEAC